MAKADQARIDLRIVIERPVVGVWHSLQGKDGLPLDPKRARAGRPLMFDFSIRIGAGRRFLGDQVRREGPVRRFVYIRIGQAAGDPSSPWSRRMKIDIHDIDDDLLVRARQGGMIEMTILGTATDGTPACATLTPLMRRIVDR